MRTRVDPGANYRAIYTDEGRTYRWRIDQSKPIGWLEYPEVVDISLGDFCNGGCSYCYASATTRGKFYNNVAEKVHNYWGAIPLEKRPFQVAIGGGGEPTLHRELPYVLRALENLGITPNYTTHGLNLTDKVIDATKRHCGGVAVTAHDHLNWRPGLEKLLNNEIRCNVHVVVGLPGSVEKAVAIREEYHDVEYVVLLPFQAVGLAGNMKVDVHKEWCKIPPLLSEDPYGYSVGALFDKHVAEHPELWVEAKLDMYDHENYSGYLMLDDGPLALRRSSYDLRLRIDPQV